MSEQLYWEDIEVGTGITPHLFRKWNEKLWLRLWL